MLFNYDRVCAKEGVAEKETASMLRWCVIACDSVGIVNHATSCIELDWFILAVSHRVTYKG